MRNRCAQLPVYRQTIPHTPNARFGFINSNRKLEMTLIDLLFSARLKWWNR
jgi:hypothetical protein